jgi:predicted GNAT superfamily acetyltransferase
MRRVRVVQGASSSTATAGLADQRLREARLGDRAAILALNAAHVAQTSALDAVGLAALLDAAFCALVVDGGASGFLIALDQDAAYASRNFLWFRDRFTRFVYIDRVVVGAAAQGAGWGRGLYQALAARTGPVMLCCEVNLDPPNPGSDAFHAALGFAECGRALLEPGGKTVRYLKRESAAGGTS